MKVNRVSDTFTTLEQKQMDQINELQEKVRLIDFDRSKDHSIIRELNSLLLNKQHSINEVIKLIEKIQKNKDYSQLGYIKRVLGVIARQGIDNE